MMALSWLYIILVIFILDNKLALNVAADGEDIPTGAFSKSSSGTLQFAVSDYPGTHAIHLHYNVNKPLSGVVAADWNIDITVKSSDGTWKHSNDKVTVKPGDIINYWILFDTTHGGFQKVNQHSTIQADTTIASTTTTARMTTERSNSTTSHTTPHPKPHTTEGFNTTTSSSNLTTTQPAPPNPHPTHSPTPDDCVKYPCVIFEDEFDTFDLKRWQHEITASGEGNWEFEVYGNNRSNSWVNGSKLHIRPTLTADIYGEPYLSSGLLDIWGNTPASQCTSNQFYGCFRQGTGTNYLNPIQSARIRTVNSFSFRYGRVEVEAKMPKGDWLWPAIWMLPAEEHYGIWPASGEIDIAESRGNTNYRDSKGKPFGDDWMASTMHWGPYFAQNQFKRTQVQKTGDFSNSFHKYAVEWDDKSITFFLDDMETMKIEPGDGGFWKMGEFEKTDSKMFNPWASDGSQMAPFDREFYLIINLAVGGTGGFFPDDAVNGGYPKPWSDKSSTANRDFWLAHNQWYPTWKYPDDTLQVNYIRISKLKADPTF